MRKIFNTFAYAAIAALALSSCAKEKLQPADELTGKLVTVHFGTENTDPSTKATLTPNDGETAFQAAWENGDVLSVYYINDNVENGNYEEGTVPATWNGSKFSAELPEYIGEWEYKAAYPVPDATDNHVDFGSNRTQKGNAYNSKYDIMVGKAVAKNAAAGKDDSGKDIVFKMDRQTAIAYFHFTSKLDEAITSATLTVEGYGAAIASSSAHISNFVWDASGDLTSITITFPEKAPNAQDFQLWFNVLETPYASMSLTVETATKTFTISKSTDGVYEAGKLYRVKKSGIAWTDKGVTPSGPTISKISSVSDFTAGTYIIMTYNETYYVPNNAATSAGPKLGSVVKNDGIIKITPDMIWNATVSGEGLEFTSYTETENKLWGAPANNGVRINKTNTSSNASTVWKLASIDSYGLCGYAGESGFDKYYLSTYATNDWRNYKYASNKFGAEGNIPANFFKVEGWVDSNYSISVAKVEGGVLSANPVSAEEGSEITLTATPYEGYKFNNDWSVMDSDNVEVTVTDGKFTMPAKNVTVTGSFSKVNYTITKATCEGGSFTVKKDGVEVSSAQIDETITLEAVANEGYEFDRWTVTNESTGKTVYVSENSFTMPGANVTVEANFVELAVVPVYSSLEELVKAGAPTEEETYVTVTLTNDEITGIYTTSKGYRNGIYFVVGSQEVEIYCQNVPEDWIVGGYVSGTLENCVWKLYNSTWELCPTDWTELSYAAPCATPEISLEGAVATITCATEGATVRYTLDETDPTETSTVYSSPVTLTDGQTIRAKAFLAGHKSSDVASKTYSTTGGSVKVEKTATIKFGTNDVKIDAASVTAKDNCNNAWTITTVGTTSFTSQPTYYQVGASKKPATSITFKTTLPSDAEVSSIESKFGGFSGTAGSVSLKVADTEIGSGSLNGTNDVTITSTKTAEGNVVTVSITGISKGVKCYYITVGYKTAE